MFLKRVLCAVLTGVLLLAGTGMVQAMEETQIGGTAEQNLAVGDGYDQTASEITEKKVDQFIWDGPVLTASKGVNQGPSGKETYYNLPMDGVIRIMRNLGFSEEEYPYWEAENGCKMLGDYIMVAANLNVHPRGSLVPCSLGMALVCDTGGFAAANPQQLDIATNW